MDTNLIFGLASAFGLMLITFCMGVVLTKLNPESKVVKVISNFFLEEDKNEVQK